LRDKKINILTLVLSEKKFLNETKNHNSPLQVKWLVPNEVTINQNTEIFLSVQKLILSSKRFTP
jgi:hypothetical protein